MTKWTIPADLAAAQAEALRARVAELEAENERLRSALAWVHLFADTAERKRIGSKAHIALAAGREGKA